MTSTDLANLENMVKALRKQVAESGLNMEKELELLEAGIQSNSRTELTWRQVELARHSSRPYSLDYITRIFDGFIELHGDRYAADDQALVGGLGFLQGRAVTILGLQKGRSLKENLMRNHGMANPEGYRKALRLARNAEKFHRPIITFVDTSGAYPGIEAEERGIGEAIARNLMEFSQLKTPIICIVIGEGGSGGALGLCVGDKVFMLENAIYSVISPEGCASILLRDATRAKEAAAMLRLTASDLLSFKVINDIIPEPSGGAHTDLDGTAATIKSLLIQELEGLANRNLAALVRYRNQKIRRIGLWEETEREEG